MGHVGCFLLGLAAGVIGMWSSHNLDRSGCFLLGIICGIILMLCFFWMLVRTIKGNIQEQEHERQDEWWRNGDPPPWER